MKYQENDIDIAVALNQGSKAAFTELYQQFFRPVYFFVQKIVGEKMVAEDIATDTFLKLWLVKGNFQNRQNVKYWLYLTARNNSLDYLKRSKSVAQHHQQIASLTEQEETYQVQAEREYNIKLAFYNRLAQEIDKLPEQSARVFKMIYFEQKKTAEIAEALNIKPQTVKNIRAYSLKLLRKSIVNNHLVSLLCFIKCLF